MKCKILNVLMVLVISLASGLSFLTGSCKTNSGSTVTQAVKPQATTSQEIIPYIPPSYYACLQVSIDDLLKWYFTHYGNLYQAEQAYNDQIFVFYGVLVGASMLVDDSTFNFSSAEFIAMQPGAVGKLKVGDMLDIVGVNRGPMPEAEGQPLSAWFDENGTPKIAFVLGWLYFTDCIFLPAGSVQLPAPGGAVFAPLY
jgi:hypothetical protein